MALSFSLVARRPSSLISFSAALASLLLLVGFSDSAKADPVDDLIEQGVRLRVQDEPAAALELFRRAHAIAPSARTLAQMGLAEGALHRWLDAEDHISSALESHDTPWIENRRNRDALAEALIAIRKHIGGVAVVGPKGASIAVNGKPAGVLPLERPVRLEEGQVHIEATAAGYSPSSVDVSVPGARDATAILEMVPILAAIAPAAAPFPLVSPKRETNSRGKTWAGIAIVGASLAAVGTGIAWIAIDGSPACSNSTGCTRLYNTGLQGWLTLGAGVAGGLGGGFLIWSGRRSTAAVDVGLGSVGLHGRF